MTACTRFEQEGLLALERGEPLDPHFETCEDCLRVRAAHRVLASRLAALGAEDRPPAGYEARILARIAAERRAEPPTASRPWRVWPLVSAVAAAAVLAVWLAHGSDESSPGPSLRPSLVVDVAASQAGSVMRGRGSAKPGDRLLVHAATGGLPHAELRVWQVGEGLLVRCSDGPPCRRSAGAIDADLVVATRGDYEVILVVSERGLAAPRRSLEEDVVALEAAGAHLERGERILVR